MHAAGAGSVTRENRLKGGVDTVGGIGVRVVYPQVGWTRDRRYAFPAFSGSVTPAVAA